MVSIGQIMAEIFCNNLDESDSEINSKMGDYFNAISFEGRTTILFNIKEYLESENVQTED
jgi:hypothetical protein